MEGKRKTPVAKVQGIVRRNDEVLVEDKKGKHSKGEGQYYRPVGGSIEFGETSEDALRREFWEELNTRISIDRYLGCLENIFVIDGETGHEIIQVYLVDFHDHAVYEQETLTVVEGSHNGEARWVPMEQLLQGGTPLFPNGLRSLLIQHFVRP